MFRGLFEHTVDDKGRVSLPSRLRSHFVCDTGAQREERLIVTCHISEPCLVVYPLEAWQALEQRVAQRSQFDPRIVRLKRLFIAPALECSIDKHGRIIVPPVLRGHAQLTREVVWAGMIDSLELWDKEQYDRLRERERDFAQKNAEEIGRDLAELGI